MTDAIEITTYGDQAHARRHEKLICLRLGLDPKTITGIRIEFNPGSKAQVTWEGRQLVPLSEIEALVAPPPPENQQCPTCTFPSRSTVGLVCLTCGWDYAANGEKPGT